MRRRFCIFTAVLALSTILKPTHITAQQSAERQSVGKQAKSPSQPNKQPYDTNKQSGGDLRGTDSSPITVKVLPTPKTEEEASSEKAQRKDISRANWALVFLTGVLGLIAFLQLIVFGRQATRLKQTIEKMDEIAAGQTNDMKDSIGQAAKAAHAMEGIAKSMESSVRSVEQSVSINREIADRQKLVTELQSRAYLSVEHYGVVQQSRATGYRFEPRAAIINRGNTPAYNVRYVAVADVLPVPFPEDFKFTLPEIDQDVKGGTIASTLNKIVNAAAPRLYTDDEITKLKLGAESILVMWGKVTYEDAFGTRRHVLFGFTYWWFEDGKTSWSRDIPQLTDSN